MLSIEKLKVIAKAKLARKDNIGAWYKNRLDICSLCPHNSDNKANLTVKDIAVVTMNLGARACLVCTCGIDAKATVRDEECGLASIGEEPLWGKLPDIKKYNLRNLHVENMTPGKVNIIPAAILILDYGTITQSSDTKIELSLEGKDSKIKNLKVQVSCGCTSAVTREVDGKYFVSISYSSKNLGVFNKTVHFTFTQGGTNKLVKSKIIGTLNK